MVQRIFGVAGERMEFVVLWDESSFVQKAGKSKDNKASR